MNIPVTIDSIQLLESLRCHPSLKVSPDQCATIIGNIVHYVMHPYFLQKSPETQEKFKDQYLAHLQAITRYCLREYVESPESHLTIDIIKGLHRNLYLGLARVSVKTPDGSEIFMVPGEFKALPNGISRRGKPNEFLVTTSPEHVARDMEMLLELLHDERAPLFQRYFRFMLDLTEIHPFPDGNGKLAALLGDLYLLKQGIHPPYFAKCKWANESEFYELAERHSLDPQRDVSIFYPLALRAYEGPSAGLPGVVPATSSLSPDTPMSFDETIEASLLPRLLNTLEKKPEQERERLILSFRAHVRLLSEYLREEIIDGTLSLDTVIGFHVRLYPPGYMILAADNHGSPDKPGNPVEISPGAWRQREIRDEPFRSHRWLSVCSPLACIESDLRRIIAALNGIRNPRREDIFRFYFQFLRVHPFADSNGTTSAVLADALCARHGLAPLLPLNVRFKDKAFIWSLCEAFDKVQNEQELTNLLEKFDAFNRSFPIQRLQ